MESVNLENQSLLIDKIQSVFYLHGFANPVSIRKSDICYSNTILAPNGQHGCDKLILRINDETLNNETISHLEWIETFPAGTGKGAKLFECAIETLKLISNELSQDLVLYIEFKQGAQGFYSSKSMQKFAPFMNRVNYSPFNSDKCTGCFLHISNGELICLK